MKTGIVLEGGAMRGMFTAGILDVFMEKGIHFDGAVGVSAGATFGINLKSHQIGRTLRYNKKYCRDKRYGGMWSLIKTGDIYNAKFDYDDIPNRLDPYDAAAHRADSMEFWICATNVDTGRPVYHRLDSGEGMDIEWLRASASMPGVSNVVHCTGEAMTGKVPFMDTVSAGSVPSAGYENISCDGLGFLDGGVSDSVPVRFFEDMGYDRIVVICTQPYGYRKQKNNMLPVLKVMLRRYPGLLDTIARRHIMYNAEMEYLDKCAMNEPDRIRVIRPAAPLNIKKVVHDPDEIQRVYDIGYAEGQRRAEEIAAFLV